MRDPLAEFPDSGFHAVLKHDAKLHAGALRCLDKRIRPFGADIDRLLGQHMKAALRRGNALGRMQAGRAADRDHVHRAMRQKCVEVVVRLPAMLAAERRDLLRVRSVDRGDLNPGNRPSSARVGLG